MSGFVAVPVAALDVCEDVEDEWAVWRLWRLADSRRHREMDASNRTLRALWCLSSRRTERLLARLVAAEVVTITDPGGARSPRRITVWRPERKRERSAERSVERSEGGSPERTPERSNTDGDGTNRRSPERCVERCDGDVRSAVRSAARSAGGSAYLGDQIPDSHTPDAQRETRGRATPSLSVIEGGRCEDEPSDAEVIAEVMAAWPGSPRSERDAEAIREARRVDALSVDQLLLIADLLACLRETPERCSTAPWWEQRDGVPPATRLPAWAWVASMLVARGEVTPARALRVEGSGALVSPQRLAADAEAWAAAGRPGLGGVVLREASSVDEGELRARLRRLGIEGRQLEESVRLAVEDARGEG